MNCRHCAAGLALAFADLGAAPPSNAYLTREALQAPETWYPLKVLVCETCWLVQTQDFAQASALFDADYAYFSGFSPSWVAHAGRYIDDMSARFSLNSASLIVEIAANDGYLLQFAKARGLPCLGVEPTASTAAAARAKGLDIVEAFFGVDLANRMAADRKAADLIVANNVLAHVPDINDFVAGVAILLKSAGVATFEFPHLMKLIAQSQFDTIYHEHFSYLSLTTVRRVFEAAGLTIFDVEELATHGGSLRVFAQRRDTGRRPVGARLGDLLAAEAAAGVASAGLYQGFQAQIDKIKNAFLGFLLQAQADGKTVAAYGAAAKGNTLMNYAGVGPDLIAYVADVNPAKQGKYMPGSRIPIVDEAHLRAHRPDYVVILPWNLRDEIVSQLDYVAEWGGRFVEAVPELQVWP